MKLKEIVESLPVEVVIGENLESEVTGGYASDLLSWVMGNAKEKNIWITIQNHKNVVAVATLIGVSAVIIAEGVEVESSTIEKAKDENICILKSDLSIYEICGKIYEILRS